MRNFSTWLLVMFMIMFWAFRAIVAVAAEFGMDFAGFHPLNNQMEIILLFVVLVCMILVVKRKMAGALIYLFAYGMYFGSDVATKVMAIFEDASQLTLADYTGLIISLIGIIIPVAILLDLLADKNRKAHPKDKKTDWFYKNEEYDRKLDDRADKNNYRTL